MNRRIIARRTAATALGLVALTTVTACSVAIPPYSPATPSPSVTLAAPTPLADPPSGTPTPVATQKSETLAPVPLTSPAALPGDVTLRITTMDKGTVSGAGPGVVQGAAQITFTLEYVNSSKKAFDAGSTEVNVTYGADRTPAVPNLAAAKPFRGEIPPGGSARGVYAFAVPSEGQDDITLTAWYAQGAPTALFHGSIR